MRRTLLTAIALATLAAPPAQAGRLEQTWERTFPFAPGETLVLRNTNGNVDIVTWDRDEALVSAAKKVRTPAGVSAEEILQALRIEVETAAGELRIDTVYPRSSQWRGWGRGVSGSVDYHITLPRRAGLEVVTVNGEVEVREIAGDLKLRTTNGEIAVRRSGGRVDARTTNGDIEVELRHADPDARMSFTTTNGGIEVLLPSDFGATVSARTTNGHVRTDLPLSITQISRRNRLEGEIGGGGGHLELTTTNGPIEIRAVD